MIAHFYAMIAHFLCESLAHLLFLPSKFWYVGRIDYFRGILNYSCMNQTNNSQKHLRPMVRVAETPRRVHMNKRRTPKGRFF